MQTPTPLPNAQFNNSASNNSKIRIQTQHCWSYSGFAPQNMEQGFGLSNLPLSDAEYCPQMCIHRISMNSQLLLLCGNSHKVISDHTNIHGKGKHWELFYFQADQDVQALQSPAGSGFKIQLLDYLGVEQKVQGKKRDVLWGFCRKINNLN